MSSISTARRQWLQTLAGLLAPSNPAEAIDALRRVAPLLDDIPEAAFTVASMKAVACAERHGIVPSYDVIVRTLREWLRDHQPIRLSLPEPEQPWRGPTSEQERENIAQGLAELRADLLAGQRQDKPPNIEARPLDRAQLAEAYRRAAAENDPFSAIARTRLDMLERGL